MTIPLVDFIGENGTYDGFDIVPFGVKWCNKNITSLAKNFNFTLADVYNKECNPKGKFSASEYKFPYEDSRFDFILSTSVFTHMLPDAVENYICESSKKLKKNGLCLITYFLMNEEAISLQKSKKVKLNFNYDCIDYRTIDIDIPEKAVAYDEKYIRKLYEKYGLTIVEPIRYGSWCGRDDYLSYQDIIIATKS